MQQILTSEYRKPLAQPSMSSAPSAHRVAPRRPLEGAAGTCVTNAAAARCAGTRRFLPSELGQSTYAVLFRDMPASTPPSAASMARWSRPVATDGSLQVERASAMPGIARRSPL